MKLGFAFAALVGVLFTVAFARNPGDGEAAEKGWSVKLPEDPKPWELTAATDLEEYLGLRIGGFPLVIEGEERPAFHVGDTAFARSKNLGADKLADERWVVKSFGRDVVIAGGGTHGTLYAVSHFLEDVLGIRFWSETEIDVPRAIKSELKKIDLAGKPRFVYRDIYRTTDFGRSSSHLAILRRLNRNGAVVCPASLGGAITYGPPSHAHTFDMYVPWKKYGAAHPEWFSLVKGKRHGGGGFNDGGQLCFAQSAVLKIMFVEQMLKHIGESEKEASSAGVPPPKFYEVSMNDNRQYCECDWCKAEAAKYNPSGVYLRFVNEIAAEIKKTHPAIYVTMLAYFFTEELPKDGVKPADNVIVKLCNTRANMAASLLHEDNKPFRDLIDGWSVIAKNLFVWDYDITYVPDSLGYPFPSELHYADKYRYFLARNVNGIFWEQEKPDQSDFFDLKYYLKTKLFENPEVDYDKLLADSFTEFFGPAGKRVLDIRRRLEAAQVRNKGFVRWFPQVSQFNYVRGEDLDFMISEYDEAEKSVKGNHVFTRRLKRARAGTDALDARRAPLLNRHGPDAKRKARFPAPREFEGRSFWDFYAPDFVLHDNDNVKLVDAPDSPIGKAVSMPIDGNRYKLPFQSAFYDEPTRKTQGAYNIPKERIKFGVYHWYPCGKFTATPAGLVYLTRQWTAQIPLPTADFTGKVYKLVLHAKFLENEVFIDRMILIDEKPAVSASPAMPLSPAGRTGWSPIRSPPC